MSYANDIGAAYRNLNSYIFFHRPKNLNEHKEYKKNKNIQNFCFKTCFCSVINSTRLKIVLCNVNYSSAGLMDTWDKVSSYDFSTGWFQEADSRVI